MQSSGSKMKAFSIENFMSALALAYNRGFLNFYRHVESELSGSLQNLSKFI